MGATVSEGEACRRYALALALVGEPNAAGDLCLAAKDEADLRRRAAAWRRRQGLPPPGADPPLPALAPEQVEHALHLERRGRRQRRLRPLLAGATALLLTAALLLAGRSLTAAPAPTLADDPGFAAPATDQSVSNGLTLALHRAGATPSSITVWWTLSGPGAGLAARNLQPELFDVAQSRWLRANRTEILPLRQAGGEVVRGKSLYRVLQITWRTAMVRAGAFGDLRAPIGHGPSSTAATLSLHATSHSGPVTVTLTSLTRGADYTVLRYEALLPSPEIRFGADAVLDTGKAVLKAVDADTSYADNVLRVQAVYPPLPAGREQVTVRFSLLAALGRFHTFPMEQLQQVERAGSTVRAVVDLRTLGVERPADAVYVDERGAQWRVDSFEPVEGHPAQVRAVANGVPPQPRLTRLVLYYMERLPEVSIPVDLGRP